MAKISLNVDELNVLIESVNDCIFRSASYIKVKELESLKFRLVKALDGNVQEPQVEQQQEPQVEQQQEPQTKQEELVKSVKNTKKPSPQV
jgi:hypothetical protein